MEKLNDFGYIDNAIANIRKVVDEQSDNIRAAARTGADRVELYTEPFATMFPTDPEAAVKPFREAAELALERGIEVNAGHDLSLENLTYFLKNVPGVKEVSIGHALICDALYYGLENTIGMYLDRIKQAYINA